MSSSLNTPCVYDTDCSLPNTICYTNSNFLSVPNVLLYSNTTPHGEVVSGCHCYPHYGWNPITCEGGMTLSHSAQIALFVFCLIIVMFSFPIMCRGWYYWFGLARLSLPYSPWMSPSSRHINRNTSITSSPSKRNKKNTSPLTSTISVTLLFTTIGFTSLFIFSVTLLIDININIYLKVPSEAERNNGIHSKSIGVVLPFVMTFGLFSIFSSQIAASFLGSGWKGVGFSTLYLNRKRSSTNVTSPRGSFSAATRVSGLSPNGSFRLIKSKNILVSTSHLNYSRSARGSALSFNGNHRSSPLDEFDNHQIPPPDSFDFRAHQNKNGVKPKPFSLEDELDIPSSIKLGDAAEEKVRLEEEDFGTLEVDDNSPHFGRDDGKDRAASSCSFFQMESGFFSKVLCCSFCFDPTTPMLTTSPQRRASPLSFATSTSSNFSNGQNEQIRQGSGRRTVASSFIEEDIEQHDQQDSYPNFLISFLDDVLFSPKSAFGIFMIVWITIASCGIAGVFYQSCGYILTVYQLYICGFLYSGRIKLSNAINSTLMHQSVDAVKYEGVQREMKAFTIGFSIGAFISAICSFCLSVYSLSPLKYAEPVLAGSSHLHISAFFALVGLYISLGSLFLYAIRNVINRYFVPERQKNKNLTGNSPDLRNRQKLKNKSRSEDNPSGNEITENPTHLIQNDVRATDSLEQHDQSNAQAITLL